MAVARNEMDCYEQTNKYVRNVLIPQIHINNEEDGAAEATKKKIKKMILFEIMQGDAMSAAPEIKLWVPAVDCAVA